MFLGKKCLKLFIMILIVESISSILWAQHQDLGEKPDLWRGAKNVAKDSTSLLNAFNNGLFKGNIRTYHSITLNDAELSDYFANAIGGGMRYQTATLYGFDAALSGFFIFNAGSSDFTKKDALTRASNRYEIQLFDLERPDNKKPIERIEELFIRYNWKSGFIGLGLQLVNTPFINLQDGRMRPTGIEGIIGEHQVKNGFKAEGGILWAISPRGTTDWFSIEKSFGITSMGVNPDGTRGNYRDSIQSKGVVYLGLSLKKANSKFQLWNLVVENVMNTTYAQWDYTKSMNSSDDKWFVGIQSIGQFAMGSGGNVNPAFTYVEKNHKSLTFGATAGLTSKHYTWSLNANRITSLGRYIMPREWGREPFYTFIPRERNEGFGDVTAFMTKFIWKNPKGKWKPTIYLGYYNLPDVTHFELNKYGLPSYFQFNTDIRYRFEGFLESIEIQWVSSYKWGFGEMYDNPKFVINKVDLFHSNLILNFYF